MKFSSVCAAVLLALGGGRLRRSRVARRSFTSPRIRTEWDEDARYEVFSVFPGTVPTGKGIFDSMDGVLR